MVSAGPCGRNKLPDNLFEKEVRPWTIVKPATRDVGVVGFFFWTCFRRAATLPPLRFAELRRASMGCPYQEHN